MRTLIDDYADLLSQVPSFQVQRRPSEMLVTVSLSANRRQTVRIETRRSRHGSHAILRLQSRACTTTDPLAIRHFMQCNLEPEWGGLALDTTTDPPAVDLIYSLLADGTDVVILCKSIQRIAQCADAIEQRMSADDEF